MEGLRPSRGASNALEKHCSCCSGTCCVYVENRRLRILEVVSLQMENPSCQKTLAARTHKNTVRELLPLLFVLLLLLLLPLLLRQYIWLHYLLLLLLVYFYHSTAPPLRGLSIIFFSFLCLHNFFLSWRAFSFLLEIFLVV